jgi:hypothetical protein
MCLCNDFQSIHENNLYHHNRLTSIDPAYMKQVRLEDLNSPWNLEFYHNNIILGLYVYDLVCFQRLFGSCCDLLYTNDIFFFY